MNDYPQEIRDLIGAMKERQKADDAVPVAKNTIHTVGLGIIAVVGMFVWNSAVSAPKDFGIISQQTAEIRTTVLEMKGTLTDITTRLDNNTRATADQQAKLTGLEEAVKGSMNRIERLEDEARRAR